MSLSKDFKEFIECLTRRRVDYLLVGGYALAVHGWPRFTKDIDFWIRPSAANAGRLLDALRDFGFADIELGVDDFSKPGQIVQLGDPPNRIDLVTTIDGVEFEPALERSIEIVYDGAPLRVIGKGDLIANKRASGRKQDLLDAEQLESDS